MKNFEYLEHPADVKICAYGKELAELFENAALGMMEYIFGKNHGKLDQLDHLIVEGEDTETLLVNWLSELLYLTAINKRKYFAFVISEFSQKKIVATVGSAKATPQNEIKAVTYHDLKIEQRDASWFAIVVYDI